MAFFDRAGVRLMLGVWDNPEFDHPSSIIDYSVGDIRGQARGIQWWGVGL